MWRINDSMSCPWLSHGRIGMRQYDCGSCVFSTRLELWSSSQQMCHTTTTINRKWNIIEYVTQESYCFYLMVSIICIISMFYLMKFYLWNIILVYDLVMEKWQTYLFIIESLFRCKRLSHRRCWHNCYTRNAKK